MIRVNKIYFREIKNRLGYYPHWPLEQKLEIGKIGYFSGRKARVDWVTSLTEQGISTNPTSSNIQDEQIYSTDQGSSFRFGIAAGDPYPKVEFNFSKKSAITFQKYGVNFEELPIYQLQTQIVQSIQKGLKWDYDWVVLTHLWVVKGFTLLVSGGKKSSVEITATKFQAKTPTFNIADVNIGLSISAHKEMAFKDIIPGELQPFFRLYRLTWANILKPYG